MKFLLLNKVSISHLNCENVSIVINMEEVSKSKSNEGKLGDRICISISKLLILTWHKIFVGNTSLSATNLQGFSIKIGRMIQ